MKQQLWNAMKRRFTGISWQGRAMRTAGPLLDAGDMLVRNRRGLADIPPLSIRIRGTGIKNEFGGRKFVDTGAALAGCLVEYAAVDQSTRLLDIGCGAGRIAYALVDILSPGNYRGLDVDRVTVEACRRSPVLRSAGFQFDHADVASEMYNNASSAVQAATYRLPYADESFDVVYLESVFTHLTGEECANYAREILRVLQPGGRAVVSGFLRDAGTGSSPYAFEHQVGDVFVAYPENPRKAVAADSETFDRWFGMPHVTRLRGHWRGDAGEYPNGQDWLIYSKQH